MGCQNYKCVHKPLQKRPFTCSKTGMIASIVEQDGFLSRKTDDDIQRKGVQEGWMCPKEGNLRSTRIGHPHVLKGGLVGKKTILDQQRALNGIQGERGSFYPWKKASAAQKDYKAL